MKKERLLYLDILRALAIILVVLCHTVELFYDSTYNNTIPTSNISFYIQTFLYLLSRLGVPIFLMITGILMINNNEMNINLFYKKYLLPLLITSEIWIIINNLFCNYFFQKDFDMVYLLKQMLFLAPLEMKQMWYIPLILGMYLFIPFIKFGIKKYADNKITLIPLLLGIFIYFFIPTINIIIKASHPSYIMLTDSLDISFIGGVGGIYMITGFFLNKLSKQVNIHILFLLFIISLAINVFFISYLRISKYEYSNFIWYTNFFTYISSINLLLIIKNITKSFNHIKIITYLSSISFPIFLIHMIILTTLTNRFGYFNFSIPFQITFYFIITLFLCICIIYISNKLFSKKIKKLFLYIR